MRRKGFSLLVVLVVIAVALSSAGKATAQDGGGGGVGALAVLYDQSGSASSQFITVQDFEPANDQYDSQAADDFAVPQNVAWIINTVEVLGHYDGTGTCTADSVDIWFYRDGGTGLPGAQIYNATVLPSNGLIDTSGNFVITLSSPPTLASGMNWVSVQTNMPFNCAGGGYRVWQWRERTAQSSSKSAFRFPNDNTSSCYAWIALQTCYAGHDPDLLFKLSGSTTALNYHVYLPLIIKGS